MYNCMYRWKTTYFNKVSIIIVNLDHFCIENLNILQLSKTRKEFFNNNTGKIGTKSSIKHRQNANKNHHWSDSWQTKRLDKVIKFFIRPPYFRRLNEYNCSNTRSNYSLCLNTFAQHWSVHIWVVATLRYDVQGSNRVCVFVNKYTISGLQNNRKGLQKGFSKWI